MGLVGWWPLNGNLKDYSGNNLELTKVGDIRDSKEGKIGSCCETVNRNIKAELSSAPFSYFKNDCSMCCWIYVTQLTSDEMSGIISNHDHENTSGMGINIFKDLNDPTKFILTCSTGHVEGDRTYKSYKGSSLLEMNKWYHLTLTYEKNLKQIKLYVNGVLDGTHYIPSNRNMKLIPSEFKIFCWSIKFPYTSYNSANKINDVRAYDHVLTNEEINNICRAKILHYKFNGVYEEPTLNLNISPIPEVNSFIHGNTDICDYEFTKIGEGHYKVRAEKKTEGNHWPALRFSKYNFIPNEVYSMSLKFKINEIKNSASVEIRHSSCTNDYWTNERGFALLRQVQGWETFVLTRPVKESYTQTNGTVFFSEPRIEIYTNMHKAGDVLEFEFKDPQIEYKPWSSPIVYGKRELLIGDSSEFGNHGYVAIGTTPKWEKGFISKMNGRDKFITMNDACKIREEGTINFWIRIDKNSNQWTGMFGGNRDGNYLAKFGISIHIRDTDNALLVKFYGELNKSDLYSSPLAVDKWHFITLMQTNLYRSVHINGVQSAIDNTVIPKLDWSKLSICNLGRSPDPFFGKEFSIKGFSVYPVALTAEEIMNIYREGLL